MHKSLHMFLHRDNAFDRVGSASPFCLLAAFTILSSTTFAAGTIKANCCDFSSNRKPVWEVALPLPEPVEDKRCNWSTEYRAQLAFTDTNKIVAGGIHFQCFVHDAHNSIPSDVKRFKTLDFIAYVDPQNGKPLNILTWDANPNATDVEILPTRDGHFLVRLGSVLKLFSSEFKEIRSRRLPVAVVDGEAEDHWAVHVSPGGRSGLLQHWATDRFHEDHWFSTESLEDASAETAPLDEIWHSTVVVDDRLYYSPQVPPAQRKGVQPPVYVRKRGQQNGHQLCSACYGLPRAAMGDGTLIVAAGERASLVLVNPDGGIIHQASYGNSIESAGGVVPAAVAPRFTFEFAHFRTILWSWKDKRTIVVFDTKKMKVAFELKVTQHPEEIPGGQSWVGMALALSPDGTKLAVLSGSILKLFEVP